jgi:uncharacterized membrane protein YczE
MHHWESRRTLCFVTRLLYLALEPLNSVHFWVRFLQLNLGLMIFGVAIALMLKSGVGLDPWSVLHEGISRQTGLSFGRITQLIGLGLIILSFVLFRIKPGFATATNMLLVGPWVNFFQAQSWVPHAHGLLWGTAQFMAGTVLFGLASGLYIAAHFGAGPRDAFLLGMSSRLGRSIRLTRSGLEVFVLLSGFSLGGPPGVGTIIFALTIGIFMQFFLRLFRYPKPAQALTAGMKVPASP